MIKNEIEYMHSKIVKVKNQEDLAEKLTEEEQNKEL